MHSFTSLIAGRPGHHGILYGCMVEGGLALLLNLREVKEPRKFKSAYEIVVVMLPVGIIPTRPQPMDYKYHALAN